VSPAVVNPAVPVALERIVGRCLAKDPARRYQSAADLRIDLEDLQGAVASARGGGVPPFPGDGGAMGARGGRGDARDRDSASSRSSGGHDLPGQVRPRRSGPSSRR